MFNRSTKLTAVLVAAASIVSSVPAMAATRLANKDGNVDNAVAFKDGRYLFEGYRTDDDDNGLYYNAGDSDKKLDDADSLVNGDSDVLKFGDKYVQAWDGSDEYVIDMTTGKISDDDIYSDNEETAETKLQNKLKKTDRYETTYGDAKIADKVDGSKFSDVWYEYTATTSGSTTSAQVLGYTNGSGNYIDCSYNANIYAYKDGKMTKIENVGDKENGITLNSISHVKTLGQDDKYIYRIISADITGAEKVKDDSTLDGTTTYFVQKVAKAQGDKEGDAYLPKTTDCYEIAMKDVLGNGDVEDAYKALVDGFDNIKYTFVDGVIYATFNDSDTKVKTYKILLKTSEKLDRTSALGGKVGAHVAKKDDDTDHDIVDKDSWCIDVNGTVWALDKGEILKSVKCGDFETVYTCDRSLDRLDVYDENNLIAWDSNGDVYTTVQEGSDEAKKEATEIVGEQPAPVAKTGWQQDATTGTWTLYDAVGTQLTGWQLVGGKYYYMDPSTGVMQTGWVKSPASGKWYYMDPVNGDMKTGWQLVGGKWYYMNPSNGDMQTGWVYDGSNWYYMYSDGSMASNTTIDGYVLNASGAWIN